MELFFIRFLCHGSLSWIHPVLPYSKRTLAIDQDDITDSLCKQKLAD